MTLAHAFGERYDLPLPLGLFVAGGAVVVLLSFLLARPRIRLADVQAAPDVAAVREPAPVRGAAAVAVLVLLAVAGLVGSQTVSENILPTAFWLVAWIVVPLSCGVLGNWTRSLNPFAAAAQAMDRPKLRRLLVGAPDVLTWPAWLGWWPAAGLYFLLVVGELVVNLFATTPANLAGLLLGYLLISAGGGLLFGPAWLQRGEVFSVLFDTWGRLGFNRFGAPGRRGFAGGLDVSFERSLSRVVFVLMLLVSVNFDGLLATPHWAALERTLPPAVGALGWRLELFRTAVFIALIGLVAAVFALFAWAAARAGHHGTRFLGALTELLPSLLPIAFGYLLSHYLQYVLVNGQLLLPLLGNPPGTSWWPLHLPYPLNDSYIPNVRFLPTGFYWYVAVVAIVVVHIIAVVLARRHLSTRARDQRGARASEYPWLVAMVAYTMLSLWLLAQPLTESKPASPPAAAAAVSMQ